MRNLYDLATKYKVHHLLFWCAYFFFWVWVYKGYYTDFKMLAKVTFVYLVAHASIYYLTQYVLIPKVLKRHNVFLFLLSFAIATALAAGFMLMAIFGILGLTIEAFGGNISQAYGIFLMSILFVNGLLISAKFLIETAKNQRNQQRLKKEQLESELQYLKAQVNPHFLFNAINSVYVLIKLDPNKAADMLIKLSDLLRAQLYDFTGEAITIEQEINYIESYIALEQIRRGNKLTFEFEKGNNLSGFRIAPLILIPFLENCFKHLSNHGQEKNIIRVKFDWSDGTFHAFFENTVDPIPVKEKQTGGIGLKNVRRRLDLIYPGRYVLDIKEGDGLFQVDLKIMIDG